MTGRPVAGAASIRDLRWMEPTLAASAKLSWKLSMHGCVVCFGELLLRLDAPSPERLVQVDRLNVSYTGGEANVAVALAGWDVPARILSQAPRHAVGDACVNHFRRYGVDMSCVVRGGERLGILFVESGASLRPPQVIYDREHSAFRGLMPEDVDWDAVFTNASWLHFTGTAPAVGGRVRETLHRALDEARSRGVRISFDCSYRSALWNIEEAARVLPPLLEQCDVFIGSESDASQFFGVTERGEECPAALCDRYQLTCAAFTSREILSSGRHRYSATIYQEGELRQSRAYEIDVVDRIGAGDAFAAGLIRGLLRNDGLAETTEFAAAAGVLAHTVPGDFVLATVDEVERLARGDDAARGWR